VNQGDAARPTTIALAGDTMLGRGVAEALATRPPEQLVAEEVAAVTRDADLFVLNLECCISERGERWPDPAKPFFFRAPPVAVDLLNHLGVDCVTLANNHTLDFGPQALLDTLEHLRAGGIDWVGAGVSESEARAPALLESRGFRVAVAAFCDHAAEYAAGTHEPGIAYAPLGSGIPDWLCNAIARSEADAFLVTPHWGPNMTTQPVPLVRAAAQALVDAGATLVAGHSAHLFHGVAGRVLYDLGDFLDDYAVDPRLRNDLGLLFLVTLAERRLIGVEAVPLRLEYCHTRLANRADAEWIHRRLRSACARLGTEVAELDGRLILRPAFPPAAG
jgi:poly-gamma-glutamate capsule biosynthesis protein CapA/YwtB (metallophosphatase superfamily)